MRPAARTGGRILIVDPNPEDRATFANVLEQAGHSTTQAVSGEEALESAREAAPDLVVIEICLPGVCGYQLCRQLRDEFGDGLPIVFVSGDRTESYDRVGGLLVGADDYFVKPVAPDELLIRLERLIRRSSPIAPTVAAKLTMRERQVLELLAKGLSPGEIAERLYISPKTVRTHVEHLLQKLGVRSRTQAVALAYRRNLIGTSAFTAPPL